MQQQHQQIQLTKQQLQQLVQHEELDDLVATSTGNSSEQMDTSDGLTQHQQLQQLHQQQLQKLSKVIKMSQFPLLVSDVNLQQQQPVSGQGQQQQLKPNSAAAIAANHNYSLHPASTAIITAQATPQQANKIFLTSSNSGGGGSAGNFTIATASEQQAAAAGQKLHYKELLNSNLKLNFVSSAGTGEQAQQVGATTVLLNKAQQQQQQQQQHQKLKTLATTGNSQPGQGDKRVLYTSLLNVKPLQKNNSGQMQMQLGGLQQVLRGRLNNSAIITRTLPLGTTVNSTGGAGGPTTTTIRQLVSTNANNVSTQDGSLLNAKDVGKALTVEQVIASANNGGVVLPTSNNNNNNNNGSGSGGNGGTLSSGVNATGSGGGGGGTGTGAGVTSTINR